ncbi:hypothetical protein AKJ08_2831 [Vulgatibacter incomptus]|uniref:Outer membrane protein beta-barrel domain-containing protein n=1 Tax=Vulgatibacter incomptus TaxID=1391653 RepID=A0A0K1PH45_9BACT|nr:hypothetical protein AKJ08_2831 [Vulgatibacter incomptus]
MGFNLALGGTIAPNLILFGEVTSSAASNPTVAQGGDIWRADRSSFAVVSIGPGLTYYFMPANVFLSGSLLLTQVQFSDMYSREDTEYGPGARLALGKEWLVGRNWGLGLAADAAWSSIPPTNPSSGAKNATTTSFGLSFSATYN